MRKMSFAILAVTMAMALGVSAASDATAQEAVFVAPNGNVGIGTSDPQARLHLFSSATADVFGSVGPSPDSGPAFNFGYGGTVFGRGAGFLNVRPDASATAPNPSLRFMTTNLERMIITNLGRVGIGTTSPALLLDLRVNASNQSVARLQNLNAAGWPGIEYYDHAGNIGAYFGLDNANSYTRLNSYRPLVILTNSVERARITATGDLGIGTPSPAARLHVNGGDIRVSGGSFIDDGVTLNTPDYVFEPGYELMPLEELQAFIAREKRLPNVPSAREVKEQGLNLSQFQMRLLEKIEELALYTLALHDENVDLKARLAALESAR